MVGPAVSSAVYVRSQHLMNDFVRLLVSKSLESLAGVSKIVDHSYLRISVSVNLLSLCNRTDYWGYSVLRSIYLYALI